MRVLICGADLVGWSIAAYLAREDNDVTVVDTDGDTLAQIHNAMDVKTITGHPSDPDVLECGRRR